MLLGIGHPASSRRVWTPSESRIFEPTVSNIVWVSGIFSGNFPGDMSNPLIHSLKQ